MYNNEMSRRQKEGERGRQSERQKETSREREREREREKKGNRLPRNTLICLKASFAEN